MPWLNTFDVVTGVPNVGKVDGVVEVALLLLNKLGALGAVPKLGVLEADPKIEAVVFGGPKALAVPEDAFPKIG